MKCKCNSTARQMNELGWLGCLKNIRPLAKQIRANAIAKNKRWRWVPLLGYGVVLIGVAMDRIAWLGRL